MRTLAQRLSRGEEAAFVELYDACAERLLGYLTVLLGSPDAAADAVQSAMLRAVKNCRQFRQVENPVAYLFQIGRNEAHRLASRDKFARHWQSLDGITPTVASNGELHIEHTELAQAAMARLNAGEREIVQLKIYGQLTFQEISQVLAKPQGTVATAYRRALEALRPWLCHQLQGTRKGSSHEE